MSITANQVRTFDSTFDVATTTAPTAMTTAPNTIAADSTLGVPRHHPLSRCRSIVDINCTRTQPDTIMDLQEIARVVDEIIDEEDEDGYYHYTDSDRHQLIVAINTHYQYELERRVKKERERRRPTEKNPDGRRRAAAP